MAQNALARPLSDLLPLSGQEVTPGSVDPAWYLQEGPITCALAQVMGGGHRQDYESWWYDIRNAPAGRSGPRQMARKIVEVYDPEGTFVLSGPYKTIARWAIVYLEENEPEGSLLHPLVAGPLRKVIAV